MEPNRSIFKFLLLLMIACDSFAEIFYNFEIGKQENPCTSKCKDAPLPLASKDVDPKGKYVNTCCQRGCRFFNLVDLHHNIESNHYHVNSTLNACETSCTEAYTVIPDLMACKIGCALMANNHLTSSLFSFAIQIEDEIRPNIMLMPPDTPESDPLPDAAKDFMSGWWDSNGFKLQEPYFKSIPIDSGSVDYGVSSEYLGENEKSSSIPGSDWLQCASRHTGIPRWILAFAIAAAILSAMWLCFAPEKPCETCVEKGTLVPPDTSKITVYVPDEAFLYKNPPPKYSEIINVTSNDSDLPV